MKNIINNINLRSIFSWLLVAFAVAIIAYILFRNDKINIITYLSLPVLAFYLSFVSAITIIIRKRTVYPQYNLILFWSYKAISDGATGLLSQILWNVVLFIPIGILLMLVLNCNNKWMVSVGIGFLLSASIEIIQLVSHRGLFEFDDMLHNTLGAVIGVVLIILLSAILKQRKIKHEA